MLPVTPRPAVGDNEWDELVLKALAGDAVSATKVGRAYARGSDAERDVPEAMRWLSRGVELGSNEARRELGLLLLRGNGTPKDPEHAALLLRQAADAGDGEAQAALGVMYAYGDGLPQDWPLAIEWSRKAADQNNPWAQANLGLYLEMGRVGAPDPVQAATWYRRAAKQGSTLAEARLGLLYEDGNGVQQDAAQAFSLYLRGALKNDPVAERLLALAFRDGVGVPANQSEAVAWLKRSAEHGDADSLYLLSEIYEQGSGVAQDKRLSWKYLLEAAEHGHALSAARVGIAYATGTSGPGIDHDAALHWLKLAVDQATKDLGFMPDEAGTFRSRQLALARYHLGMILLAGDKANQDVARAIELFWYASEHDCAVSTNELGQVYRLGIGVPRNYSKAVGFYQAAANAGISTAAFNLAEAMPLDGQVPGQVQWRCNGTADRLHLDMQGPGSRSGGCTKRQRPLCKITTKR